MVKYCGPTPIAYLTKSDESSRCGSVLLAGPNKSELTLVKSVLKKFFVDCRNVVIESALLQSLQLNPFARGTGIFS